MQTQPGGCTQPSAVRFVLPQGLPPRLVSALPSVPRGVERLQDPSGYRECGTNVLFLVLREKSQQRVVISLQFVSSMRHLSSEQTEPVPRTSLMGVNGSQRQLVLQ